MTAVKRMYGHELRTAIVALLAAMPGVVRVNYLEYWNDQTFLIFLEPLSAQAEVEARLCAFVEASVGQRSAGVRWRFLSVRDPVPSSATLWRRNGG